MFSPEERRQRLDKIRNLPVQLRELVSGLSEHELNTHFLENEWTVAQNVHHLADSHLNSFIRLKLILTEPNPPLKGYDQDAWAELPDMQLPIEDSLLLLTGLHRRWVKLFESIKDDQWAWGGTHSESGLNTIEDLLRIYSDHCDAHLDQIKRTLAAQPA